MARTKAIVRGDKELRANLRRAQRSVGGAFMDQTLRAALTPMKEKTSENAKRLRNYAGKHPGFPDPPSPRKGGHLDQGVVIAKRKAVGSYQREFWVSFSKRARKKAHLVEFGTAPHFQPNFKGGFHHPGAMAKPFFRPAFEQTKQDVIIDVGQLVWRRISGVIIGSVR